jgi:hypothetical protein
MHILLAIPSPSHVDADFALGNLQDVISHTRKTYPDWKVSTAYQTGVRTDQNRNAILKKAIEDGTVDYILWLDADMLYPAQIVERYFDTCESLGQEIDVIGCLYFKRSYPYDPIAYELNDTENKDIKPFRSILPSAIKEDTVYEVAGLGYGGMMVNMKVYEKLGEKKWTRYGENFHLPFDAEGHLTHDLIFCKDVKEAGMSIKLHGGVRPGHLCVHPVTIEDWQRATEESFQFKKLPPKVLVVMPTTDTEQAKKAAEIMRIRAGADCDIAIVEDDKRIGFISVVNTLAQTQPHDVIVYTAQDALVGNNWLKHALMKMMITDAGLVGFHDGKWQGKLASFGMVQRSWFKNIYNGEVFHPGYHAHYADTELTQIAKEQGRYAYAEKAVMIEVDWDKAIGRGKGVVKADKKLYKKRKEDGFGGLVTSPDLLKEFS